jgi:hypothetical protein
MFITTLLNKIFNANHTPNNTVNWTGTNGLKFIQDDIVEEIRARGCVVVPTTADLSNQGKNNSQNAIVQGVGLYTWFPPPLTPISFYIVNANDGGYWVFQQPNVRFLPDLGVSVPTTNASGIVLYNSGNALKYITSTGAIKTVTVTP